MLISECQYSSFKTYADLRQTANKRVATDRVNTNGCLAQRVGARGLTTDGER